MLSLTLRQLEYALAVADHRGLTAAALALHVSQPALSVALAQLEARLGQPLFLRRPGGPLTPTAFGAAWLSRAQTHVAGLGALMRGEVRAPLRLGIFEDLAPAILAPLIARFPDLAPRPMGFAALAVALEGGEIDAALSWALGLPPGPRHLLARIAPRAVLAPDHPLAGHATLTLAQIAAHPLVLTDQDLSIAHVQSLFHAAGLAPRIAHRCASLDLMRSFAANGLGVGLSWTQPAPSQSHDGRPLVLREIRDAPREAVVLALAPGMRAEPGGTDLPEVLRFLTDHLALMAGSGGLIGAKAL
jgi:DNA-binding transcriptional LysR family regulator